MKNNYKVIARGKYILVKPDPLDPKTNPNGIIIPASKEQEPKSHGQVINVGKEVVGVSKGDRVVFGKFAGEDIAIVEKGKEIFYKLLFDDDVIAFIE